MSAGQSRLRRVVFGCPDPMGGAAGVAKYSSDAAAKSPLRDPGEIECAQILKDFSFWPAALK
jgi:tRNA(Arg) A34 adenosine deaminase TadA